MTRCETFGCVSPGLQMYHLTPNDTAWLCAKCVNDRKQGLADPKEVLRQSLQSLRACTTSAVIERDSDIPAIPDSKDVLMQEFLAAGRSLELTERDLVVLLYKVVWDPCTTPLSGYPGEKLKAGGAGETL